MSHMNEGVIPSHTSPSKLNQHMSHLYRGNNIMQYSSEPMAVTFCLISSCGHSFLKNAEVKRRSLSDMIHFGRPTKGNTQSLNSLATPSASIVSLQGTRMTAFVQL